MKKTVLIFGLVIGAILGTNTVIMMNQMCSNPDFKGNDILGYAAMVVIFSLIFFGKQRAAVSEAIYKFNNSN